MNTSKRSNKDIIMSVKGVQNQFGDQTIHKGLNLEIMRGEVIGIIGSSGSGKSVLLKTLAGLHLPDKGNINIDGKPINDITSLESASLLGVLFQEGALFSSLTSGENIILPLKEYTSLQEEEQVELARLKLALVGLDADTFIKYPSELSGGMTKRVALARALALDPLILFLDEPTSGLDPINANGFDELILHLNQSLNVTVVVVTHDLNTLFTICDRVAVLSDKSITVDTIPNLLKLDNQWIKDFFQGSRGIAASAAAKYNSGGKRGKQ